MSVFLFTTSHVQTSHNSPQTHGLYLSDIPLHDMSSDFVVVAEQRQAEAEAKKKLEVSVSHTIFDVKDAYILTRYTVLLFHGCHALCIALLLSTCMSKQ